MRAEEESGSSFQLPGVVRSLIPREVLEKGAGVASPSVRPHPPPLFFFSRSDHSRPLRQNLAVGRGERLDKN